MNYIVITCLIFIFELLYFKIADRYHIVDRPSKRGSSTSITLRGGGIVFWIGTFVYFVYSGFQYPFFMLGLTLISLISFWDDIHSLPPRFRLVMQFISMTLMFYQQDLAHLNTWWMIILALIVCVGVVNVFNFMDGINGITAGYSLAVLVPMLLQNRSVGLLDNRFLVTSILSVLVFSIFNFRPKGKAKCFAGDVGSVSIAFILLFAIGKLILAKHDITYLIFLIVYGVDAVLTIIHRMMLHENLGEAHRKHAYQLMANELKIGHVEVSLFYALLQMAISLVFIYICPGTSFAHWMFLLGTIVVLSVAYILFMKRYYHLHEEYLTSLKDRI